MLNWFQQIVQDNDDKEPPPLGVPEAEMDAMLEHGYHPERCPCYEPEEPSLDDLEREYQEYLQYIQSEEGC